MAIARDASTTSNASAWGTGSSATFSHTCSGSDRLLLVYTFNNGNSGDPTGITYNSVAMTKINTQATDGGGFKLTLWGLLAPATGSNSVVVTWATGDGINNCTAFSYTGVKQSGLPDSSNTGSSASSSSISVSTTVVASNCWLAGCTRSSNATQSGGTNASIVNACNSNGSQCVHDSNGTVGTGSQTATINVSPNNTQWMNLISIAPAVAGGPANLKSYNTNLTANIKSIDTNVIANIKSLNTNV